jgi:hypothetical protein
MQSQTSPARWLRVTGKSVATVDSGQNTAVALR